MIVQPNPRPKTLFTEEQYLTYERQSESRHEYIDGEILAMTGESGAHADVSANTVAAVVHELRGKPCRARTKDTKVRSGPPPGEMHVYQGLYSYPDVVVICGEPTYHDDAKDVITNPTAIIEVLSPSTEAFDRGEKFNRYYVWNPSLKDYLLISQDQPQVDHYTRADDGEWKFRRLVGLKAVAVIDSIECRLKLADVYDRVKF